MKALAILGLGSLLLVAPAIAQDRIDRDMDSLRGYGTHTDPGPFNGNQYGGTYGGQYGYDRFDPYYSGGPAYDDRYSQPNSWAGSYRDTRPDYGDRRYRDPDDGRRGRMLREYRDGRDWCFYRGEYRNGWSC